MSHASMLKARRQHQKSKKLIASAAKEAKRLAKQALVGTTVKKEKVKKERVKKEKVKTERVKKVKPTQGGAWQAGVEEEQCGGRKEGRVLAIAGP